jgi:hypothetical protein
MKVTAILKKQNDTKREPESGLSNITQQLLAGLVENEINSAFIFVAVAQTAYRLGHFSDGNAALRKAETIHAQAAELARDACGTETQQAIADRLRELRTAIASLLIGDVGV